LRPIHLRPFIYSGTTADNKSHIL